MFYTQSDYSSSFNFPNNCQEIAKVFITTMPRGTTTIVLTNVFVVLSLDETMARNVTLYVNFCPADVAIKS